MTITKEALSVKLPKWTGLVVHGKKITATQAAEVIMGGITNVQRIYSSPGSVVDRYKKCFKILLSIFLKGFDREQTKLLY